MRVSIYSVVDMLTENRVESTKVIKIVDSLISREERQQLEHLRNRQQEFRARLANDLHLPGVVEAPAIRNGELVEDRSV